MKQNHFRLLICAVLLIAAVACTPHWAKTIRSGKTLDGAFVESVQTDICSGLHIVPVRMGGETYRFLFDTGATFSISEEIQQKMNYKVVSKGSLSDSDNNSQRVIYVQTDSIFIGKIPFTEQTAFVADFTKNPIIECFEIDGIIGSNLMRHCNWTIDYQNAEIVLYKDTILVKPQNSIQLPFTFNRQFDQIINMKFGKATLKNLKIDYGSNGSLTLSQSSMKTLKEHDIISKTFIEKGFISSGLHGKVKASSREFAWADTLQSGDLRVEGVEIKTGKSGLIGGEILSRFIVTLDFKNQMLGFSPVQNAEPDYRTFGFRLAYSEKKQFYIQAITENSPADKAGLTVGLQVIKLNELDFKNGSNFCDYVNYTRGKDKKLELVYIDETAQTKTIILQKEFIY